MPPTMGCSTEAGQGGPIVKALAVANAAVRKPPDVWRKYMRPFYMRHFNHRRPPKKILKVGTTRANPPRSPSDYLS
jgi:hypothetical protein